MVVATAVELRNRLHEYLSRAQYGRERVIVTRNGKPVAVVVSMADLELLQTVEDRLDLEEAEEALRDVAREDAVPWEQVKAEAGC
jgi:prevent-host-death family protein